MSTRDRIERLQSHGYKVETRPNKILKVALTTSTGEQHEFKNIYQAHIWVFGY